MAGAVRFIPDGFHTATPYLIVRNASAAIDFYKRAFGAVELTRHADPSGKIRHAEFRIGDSPFMLTDEWSEFPEWQGPQARGGTPVHIYLYVEDADALFAQAVGAGAKQLLPMQNQFYGDRSGGITDPFGHVWYIATRIEQLSEEEIQRRAAAAGKA
jgi:PhnB protein